MVISIASQKGGTGKTSTSISLAAGLAHKGKRVLLVDIDSQANSSKVLLHHYPKISKEQTIYATILDRRRGRSPGEHQDYRRSDNQRIATTHQPCAAAAAPLRRVPR